MIEFLHNIKVLHSRGKISWYNAYRIAKYFYKNNLGRIDKIEGEENDICSY